MQEADLFSLVPGGAAMDASVAVRLQKALELVSQGGEAGEMSDGQLSDVDNLPHEGQLMQQFLGRFRPSVLVPALQVLSVMATAVPSALAGSSCSAVGRCNSDHRGKRQRSALTMVSFEIVLCLTTVFVSLLNAIPLRQQVQELFQTHREAMSVQGTNRTSCSAGFCYQEAAPMTVTASPSDLGLCEPAALATALWAHVTALLIQVGDVARDQGLAIFSMQFSWTPYNDLLYAVAQVLRIDQVVPASSSSKHDSLILAKLKKKESGKHWAGDAAEYSSSDDGSQDDFQPDSDI